MQGRCKREEGVLASQLKCILVNTAFLAYCASACVCKLPKPCVVAVLCCEFSLQHGLAASVCIILGRLNVVDNRCIASGAALCTAEKADRV